MSWELVADDVMSALGRMPNASFDAVLSDPPYGLAFMGRAWDASVPGPDVWSEVLRVLRPGAPMIVFGGTRTFHRLACALEDAGAELRDCLMWIYGSGFPKSLDISKAIDKAAGAERVVVGHKGGRYKYAFTDASGAPMGKISPRTNAPATMASAGNITAPATPEAARWSGYGTALKPAWEPALLARKPLDGTVAANAIKHGVGGIAIDACRVFTDWSERPESWKRSGHSANPEAEKIAAPPGTGIECHVGGRWPANVLLDDGAAAALDKQSGALSHGGGASRFFYVAKASRLERGEGNNHPTVKPIALAQYLARLILPPNAEKPRRILVPYAGSGAEVIGALQAGWEHVTGIERETEYVAIARHRIERWVAATEPLLQRPA